MNKTDLHPYQVSAIKWLITKGSKFLLADCGLGKTIITLSAITYLLQKSPKGKIVVVAPPLVADQSWDKEILSWEHTKHLKYVKVLGSPKRRKDLLNQCVAIYITTNTFAPEVIDHIKPNMIVIDESSKYKSHSSNRFKYFRKYKKTNLSVKFVLLTGTPSPNSIQDLWTQCYMIDGGNAIGKTITSFRDRFMMPENPYVTYSPWVMRKGMTKVVLDRIRPFTKVLKAEDYVTIPKATYTKLHITMPSAMKKEYKNLAKGVLELSDDAVIADSQATIVNKLLQFCNGSIIGETVQYNQIHNLKLNMLKEKLEELESENVIIFYNYINDFNSIMKLIPRAGTSDTKDMVFRWNNNELHRLVLHPKSAGHGLNLQHGGRHIIWFSLPWSLDDYMQSNARVVRQGQKHKSFIHHIMTDAPIEQRVYDVLTAKKITQDLVKDTLNQ